GSDSCQDRVALMAQLLHMSAGYFARDPVVSAARALGRRGCRARLGAWFRGVSDFSVEGHRGFQCDQRLATTDVLGKTFIQLSCFRRKQADVDFDTRPAE